jgi:hypothetical protein
VTGNIPQGLKPASIFLRTEVVPFKTTSFRIFSKL